LKSKPSATIPLLFRAVDEAQPGKSFLSHFERQWPRYAPWYFAPDRAPRPDAATCRARFAEAMPRLVPALERLCALAPEGADKLARFFTLYRPPAFLTGCSQAGWRGGGLLRNYDFFPGRFEGTVMRTCILQPVLCLSDCLWGVLDGINAAGLAVSLAFGGTPHVGDGFGIPVILRCLLETCHDVPEALAFLGSIASHMDYNLTLADAAGAAITVQAQTDQKPLRTAPLPIATNHQRPILWRAYAENTISMTRELFLANRLKDPAENLDSLTRHFLGYPLYQRNYRQGFGTLYTAVYECAQRSLTLHWPDRRQRYTLTDPMPEPFEVKLRPWPRRAAAAHPMPAPLPGADHVPEA